MEELLFDEGRKQQTFVEFYRRPKQDDEQTLKEGRPIFTMREYVRISASGERDQIDRPLRETDKQQYAPQYRAFLANEPQAEAGGTPLSAWGGVPPERVEEYRYFKIATVEQLAGVSDVNLQRLGPGATNDRQKAKDFIEAAKGQAPLLQLRSELEAANADRDLMKLQLKDLGDKLEALMREKGKGK